MPASRVSPHVLLALTAFFWAAHWIVARAVHPHVTPLSLAFWRWAAAIAFLAPFAAPALAREWPRVRAAWRPILFFGTGSTVLYNAIGYVGIKQTTATNAVLFQSVTPALIPLFAFLLFGERIRPRAAAGRFVPAWGSVLGTLYLGLFPSVVCYFLWNRGVAEVGPSRAGVYLHLIPLFGALMAVALLGEELRLYHVVGIVLILLGIRWVG